MRYKFISGPYYNALFREIKSSIDEGGSIAIFMPIGYEYLDVWDYLLSLGVVDEVIDVRRDIFKLYHGNIDRYLKFISGRSRDGRVCLIGLEYLRHGFSRIWGRVMELLSALHNNGSVIIIFEDWIRDTLVRHGWSVIWFRELSLDELYSYRDYFGDIGHDKLYFSEGNLGALYRFHSYGSLLDVDDWIILESINMDSGQRFMLAYLARSTLGTGGGSILGSQYYVYVKRLIDRGLIYRVPGRKGNYLIKNPIHRIVLRRYLYGEDYYKVSGYLYLILKLFLSINGVEKIDSQTLPLYVSSPRAVRWIDLDRVRFMDVRGRRYTMIFKWDIDSLDRGWVESNFYFHGDARILVSPKLLDPRTSRILKSSKVCYIDSLRLNKVSRRMGFPRPL